MTREVVLLLLLIGFAAPASASDLDNDTRSRHDRASAPSGGDDDDDDDTFDDDDAFDTGWSDDGTLDLDWSPSIVGQAQLLAGVHFDNISGTAGGEVVHQDGLGFGFALDVSLFASGAPRFDRVGANLSVNFQRANLLVNHRPEGVFYFSDLALSTVEVDVGPRWVKRVLHLEVTLGLGFGVTWMGAEEDFSDGLELNETLALGGRFRPYLALSPTVEANASRPFLDLGVAFFAGDITPYEEDYDSLVAGLESVMATPYLRTGYLFALGSGVFVGTNYELEVIGARFVGTSLSHRAQVMLRLMDETFFEP